MATQYMIRAEMEYKKCFTTYINRPGAADLLQWMCGRGFFEAPASMKHHGAEPGGLARHSINVFERLAFIAAEAIKPPQIFNVETLAVCGLLHDLCKIDAYKEAFEGSNRRYVLTKNFPAGHGEKSVILIMRFMHLTDEEVLAIRWHMGQYDFYAKGGGYDLDNAFHQCKLAVMLHLADMMATHFDETENRGETKEKDYEAEWKVEPGPGGWAVGWFVCGKCGKKSAEDKEICPNCKAKMKKIKWG